MKHLALIMDGNRRWAKKQGLLSWRGHGKGVETVKRVIEFCIQKKIPYLSLFTFSIENFRRSPEELSFLFDLLALEAESNLEQFVRNGVRIQFVGDRSLFPAGILGSIERLEKATQHLATLHVSLLFCYGGQQEIVNGIKNVVRKVQAGLLTEDQISEDLFKDYLWTSGTPEPDLIIRTGGHHRLSNFLLYQAAYSELYFLDCLWPELETFHLEKALDQFELRQRNFGA
jgi:undecaprenyl diphosphate synthase